MSAAASEQRARDAIAANPVWYHTIELAPGVVTPGRIDLRAAAARVLPGDMSGMRALDVGTFDGFWAFEMERRGAEVVAIDVDALEAAEWPPLAREQLERAASAVDLELGRGFALAAGCLGSRARRVVCPVYELDPERIGGPVDFAFSGAILLHLRDPVRALERIGAALAPGGELRLLEPFAPWLTLRAPRRPAASFQAIRVSYNWWIPNLAGLRAYLAAASFAAIARIAIVRPPTAGGQRRQWLAGLAARRPSALAAGPSV